MKILVIYNSESTEALLSAAYIKHWHKLKYGTDAVEVVTIDENNRNALFSGSDLFYNCAAVSLLGLARPIDFVQVLNNHNTPVTIIDHQTIRPSFFTKQLVEYENAVYYPTQAIDRPTRSIGQVTQALYPNVYTVASELSDIHQGARNTSANVVSRFFDKPNMSWSAQRLAYELISAQPFFRNRSVEQAVAFLDDCVAGQILDAINLP